MNLEKVYHDSDDNERNILQMVKCEPHWAANRIQAGEDAIAENKALTAQLSEYSYQIDCRIEEADELKEAMRKFVKDCDSGEAFKYASIALAHYKTEFKQLLRETK